MEGIHSQEHYDLMTQFERDHTGLRLARENKSLWPTGHIYQNGEANSLFVTYRKGYALGRAVERNAATT